MGQASVAITTDGLTVGNAAFFQWVYIGISIQPYRATFDELKEESRRQRHNLVANHHAVFESYPLSGGSSVGRNSNER